MVDDTINFDSLPAKILEKHRFDKSIDRIRDQPENCSMLGILQREK
jgi:hypothetical protein